MNNAKAHSISDPQAIHPHRSENRLSQKYDFLDDSDFLKNYATSEKGNPREMRFYLEGVHCASCIQKIEKIPKAVIDAESIHMDLSTSTATVRIRPHGNFSHVAEALEKQGYIPHPVQSGEFQQLREKEDRRHLIQLGLAGMASGNIMFLAIALYAGATGELATAFRWASLLLFLPVVTYSAQSFYKSAWTSLKKFQISIDVPIVLGILTGTAVSVGSLVGGFEHIYFDSLSAIVFLLLSTRYLLRKMHQKTESVTRVLQFLAPSRALKRIHGTAQYETVKTETLKIGDHIRTVSGECIPTDGIVIKGISSVDASLLTGESNPIAISPGIQVYAGTWNLDGPLEIKVTASTVASRLGMILATLEKNLQNKAPFAQLLDRVGQAFAVATLVLTAVGFFLGWQISGLEAWNRALAVALVVCPCTFALATPLAFSLALGRCAKNGILIKGAEVIERLSQVKSVFFDKTGTLTTGKLEMSEWEEFIPGTAQILLALEMHSTHPIAKAVQRYFSKSISSDTLPSIQNFNEKMGFGVSGYVETSTGNCLYEVHRFSENSENQHRGVFTSVGIFKNRQLAGRLKLSDLLRTDSFETVEKLKRQGLEIHLLSGDSEAPVTQVADQLGIHPSNVLFGISPEKKSQTVQLADQSLMVGDGANDAIALASAFESIAVHGGMEISMKAAGAYSTRPGISAVSSVITVSRETMKVIYRNLVFAILYNLVGITIALSGHLTPLFAAVLMPMSALTVFLSTLAGTRKLRTAFRQDAR